MAELSHSPYIFQMSLSVRYCCYLSPAPSVISLTDPG